MDMFSDFLKDVFRGSIRAVSAFVFQKLLFKNEKTTRRRQKQKGGTRK